VVLRVATMARGVVQCTNVGGHGLLRRVAVCVCVCVCARARVRARYVLMRDAR